VLDEPFEFSEKVGLIEDSENYSNLNTIGQNQPINSTLEIPKKDNFGDSYRYVNREKTKIEPRQKIFDGNMIDMQVFQKKNNRFTSF
jgi:hypothetical protein